MQVTSLFITCTLLTVFNSFISAMIFSQGREWLFCCVQSGGPLFRNITVWHVSSYFTSITNGRMSSKMRYNWLQRVRWIHADLLAIWSTVMTICLPSVTICNHSSKLGCHYFSTPAFCICYYQKFAPSPLISAAFMHGGITSYPSYYTQFMVYNNCFACVVGSYTRNSYASTPMDRLHAVPSMANYTSQSECPIIIMVSCVDFLLMESLTC